MYLQGFLRSDLVRRENATNVTLIKNHVGGSHGQTTALHDRRDTFGSNIEKTQGRIGIRTAQTTGIAKVGGCLTAGGL